jgi:hypothetical protein
MRFNRNPLPVTRPGVFAIGMPADVRPHVVAAPETTGRYQGGYRD